MKDGTLFAPPRSRSPNWKIFTPRSPGAALSAGQRSSRPAARSSPQGSRKAPRRRKTPRSRKAPRSIRRHRKPTRSAANVGRLSRPRPASWWREPSALPDGARSITRNPEIRRPRAARRFPDMCGPNPGRRGRIRSMNDDQVVRALARLRRESGRDDPPVGRRTAACRRARRPGAAQFRATDRTAVLRMPQRLSGADALRTAVQAQRLYLQQQQRAAHSARGRDRRQLHPHAESPWCAGGAGLVAER